MKRSLTAAAAVLASGAGVIGWTGAASAATPQLLPVEDAIGQSASQLTDQVHSVQRTVGGVVPLEQQPTSRDLALPLGDLANVNLGSPGSGLQEALSGKAPLLDLPTGRALQDDGQSSNPEQASILPASESTAPGGTAQPDQHGVEVVQHGQDGADGLDGVATAHGTSNQEQTGAPGEQQSLVDELFAQVNDTVPVARLVS